MLAPLVSVHSVNMYTTVYIHTVRISNKNQFENHRITFSGISGAPMPGLDEEIANLAVAEVDRVLETYW